MGTTPELIKKLVDRFDRQKDQIRSPDYNETLIRIDFINPLMSELGWDIDNRQGFAEQYREVVHEDRVRVSGQTKAPDYSFRVGGVRKFFLEAKKPAVDIRNNWEPAYQLRRYAWSAKLCVSLLTDFEEFAIYDARIQPKQLEKASVARRDYLRYTDYESRWDFLVGTFSKDAVLKGEFDRYCDSKKGRGAQLFDDAFLGEIEEWRKSIATSLARNNSELDAAGLNFAVQRIIDRIIFLRIAEDRGTETVGQLQALLGGDNTYARLQKLFHDADVRYNSGLFHFVKEKDRQESPDTLTPDLQLDDNALKKIIRALYYPQSPYEFTMVSADILGSVYERFLGKVITLTTAHSARIEEKPEVRKAGGVYYTPTYIVDYIVQNTVGKLLESSPCFAATRSGALPRLKILDPACGSGSFLIGAYQFLLDHYHTQYTTTADPAQLATGKNPLLRPAFTPSPGTPGEGRGGGRWSLTISTRKRILLDHIHGVDLDSQAVEVTKLNLLLKCLEGETSQTLGFEQRLFRERALPDLGKNIQCGNSLIATDIIGSEAWNEMTEDERRKINPFDYERAFPQVFKGKDGGFDAVIGNPPYIRIQGLSDVSPATVRRLKERYKSAATGNYDIYVVFVERALQLCDKRGTVGFILPHKFFVNSYGEPLRALIGSHVRQIVHFGHQQVFESATTYTCLLFLDKERRSEASMLRVEDLAEWKKTPTSETAQIASQELTETHWNLAVGDSNKILTRLAALPRLDSIARRIFQGIKTGADPVFILDCRGGSLFSKALGREVHLEQEFLRRLGKSGDFKRYALAPASRAVIFPYRAGRLVDWSDIESQAPQTASYLTRCHSLLNQREKGRFAGDDWYMYSRSQALEVAQLPKLLTADLNPRPNFCVDETGETCFTGGAAGGYGLLVPDADRLFLLGILNSRVTDFVIRATSSAFRGGWYSYEAKYLRSLPIPPSDNGGARRISLLAESLLSLHNRLASEHIPQHRDQIQREIDATDRQIDQLVYQLYGLSDDEIRIVEGATQ